MRLCKMCRSPLILILILVVGCQQERTDHYNTHLDDGALTRYAKEISRYQDAFSNELSDSKVEPVEFVVNKLYQESSIESQSYADALNQVLSHAGTLADGDNGSRKVGDPLDASQEARIDVLTHLLLTHLPEGESPARIDMRWQLLKTVASRCPTGEIVDVLSNLPSEISQERRNEICRLIFSRMLDKSRSPSASLVSHLLAIRIGGYAPVFAYGETLINPRGIELSDLMQHIDGQIRRQIGVDRAGIDSQLVSSRSQAAQFLDAVKTLDDNFATLEEDRNKSNEFFKALWDNDSQSITQFVGGDLEHNWVKLRNHLFAADAKSFQIESISPSLVRSQLHITLKIHYSGGLRYEQFSLVVDRSHGWHLSSVQGILL